MKRKFHVRFLGGGSAARRSCYPTHRGRMRPARIAWCILLVLMVALASFGAWCATRPHLTPGDPGEGTAHRPAPTHSPEKMESVAAVPLPATREAIEATLKPCLGRTVREVVQLLDLGEAKPRWTQEPPGTLRGASYFTADERSITLYIAEGEPLFRQFNDFFEWDYEAFLRCRVGGIQYSVGEVWLDLGPAVPWQWRRE
jgi:hypothetical protein